MIDPILSTPDAPGPWHHIDTGGFAEIVTVHEWDGALYFSRPGWSTSVRCDSVGGQWFRPTLPAPPAPG